MKKRYFLQALAAMTGTACLSHYLPRRKNEEMATANNGYEITRTEQEWRESLTPEQFRVLREHGTERAGTSHLDKQYGQGTYACAACGLPLFSSKTKFDSGTGWPSFTAPIEGAVGTSLDRSFFMTRVEVHCRRCGGHLGHVFDDGPRPTGKRYCMNGVALKFIPGRSSN
jgi:peptide-methionine (R)-S-oxide reductase